jgi:neurotransmitter:Na+ symporter, NSS family
MKKERVALWICVLGFFCSVAFVTDIGIYLLDIFDHFLFNYALMVTGAMEAYVIAWVWAWPEMRDRTGFV